MIIVNNYLLDFFKVGLHTFEAGFRWMSGKTKTGE